MNAERRPEAASESRGGDIPSVTESRARLRAARRIRRRQLAPCTAAAVTPEAVLEGLRDLWHMVDPTDRWKIEHTAAQVKAGRR